MLLTPDAVVLPAVARVFATVMETIPTGTDDQTEAVPHNFDTELWKTYRYSPVSCQSDNWYLIFRFMFALSLTFVCHIQSYTGADVAQEVQSGRMRSYKSSASVLVGSSSDSPDNIPGQKG